MLTRGNGPAIIKISENAPRPGIHQPYTHLHQMRTRSQTGRLYTSAKIRARLASSCCSKRVSRTKSSTRVLTALRGNDKTGDRVLVLEKKIEDMVAKDVSGARDKNSGMKLGAARNSLSCARKCRRYWIAWNISHWTPSTFQTLFCTYGGLDTVLVEHSHRT